MACKKKVVVGREEAETAWLRKWRDRLLELSREVTDLTLVCIDAHERAKAAKKRLESAQEKLQVEVDKGRGEDTPLLDQAGKSDEAWKTVPLAALEEPKIPAGILEKLEAAAVRTLGDLSKLDPTVRGAVKGIGQAKWAKITEAVDAFWSRDRGTVIAQTAPKEGPCPR